MISANGGAGDAQFTGGGGGGRIVILTDTNQLTGKISAYGGAGLHYGGAGTILTRARASQPRVLVDNGGHRATNTLVGGSGLDTLRITGSAIAEGEILYSLKNL